MAALRNFGTTITTYKNLFQEGTQEETNAQTIPPEFHYAVTRNLEDLDKVNNKITELLTKRIILTNRVQKEEATPSSTLTPYMIANTIDGLTNAIYESVARNLINYAFFRAQMAINDKDTFYTDAQFRTMIILAKEAYSVSREISSTPTANNKQNEIGHLNTVIRRILTPILSIPLHSSPKEKKLAQMITLQDSFQDDSSLIPLLTFLLETKRDIGDIYTSTPTGMLSAFLEKKSYHYTGNFDTLLQLGMYNKPHSIDSVGIQEMNATSMGIFFLHMTGDRMDERRHRNEDSRQHPEDGRHQRTLSTCNKGSAALFQMEIARLAYSNPQLHNAPELTKETLIETHTSEIDALLCYNETNTTIWNADFAPWLQKIKAIYKGLDGTQTATSITKILGCPFCPFHMKKLYHPYQTIRLHMDQCPNKGQDRRAKGKRIPGSPLAPPSKKTRSERPDHPIPNQLPTSPLISRQHPTEAIYNQERTLHNTTHPRTPYRGRGRPLAYHREAFESHTPMNRKHHPHNGPEISTRDPRVHHYARGRQRTTIPTPSPTPTPPAYNDLFDTPYQHEELTNNTTHNFYV